MDAYAIYALLTAGACLVWLMRDRKKNVSRANLPRTSLDAHLLWSQFPGVPAIGSENWFLSWLTVLKAKTQGAQFMQEGYDKVRGRVSSRPLSAF